MADTHARSIVKAVAWRACGAVFTAFVGSFVTGSLKMGISIAVLDSALKIGAFYAHERIWQRIGWGRTDAAAHDQGEGI